MTERIITPAWRPPTDAELRGMKPSEAAREHSLLASMKLRLAGPMWGPGGAIAIENMPEGYHRLKTEAKNHADESDRLMAYVFKPQDDDGEFYR